jgi:hypothetical protein
MSIIEKLTEGIVNRDMKAEGHALLNKWSATGLLEGLDNQHQKATMARLLENQAKELLRESSSMQGQNVEGFASVAFPIVRRVFAGLIANDLVSVQPMSLPSGLIFFLDFTTNSSRLGYTANESIYGQNAVAKEISDGVSLDGAYAEKGPHALNNGYASATGSLASKTLTSEQATFEVGSDEATDKLIRFDPDLASGSYAAVVSYTPSAAELADMAMDNLVAFVVTLTDADGSSQVRRLTSWDGTKLSFVFHKATTFTATLGATSAIEFPRIDSMEASDALGSVIASSNEWQLEENAAIPEIDIKVDSIAITAQTKKLKAKWTPELGQDLNAYHNLDAEVELTSILSEQIALEIDREILEDLIKGATAATYYWSRSPGLFVDRSTGLEIGAGVAAPDFTGTVSEWYETLIETINDVSAQIHRKTLRGGANFVVCGPEVANILEFTSGFRANVTAEADKGAIGAVNAGSLSRKFDVIVDPYFPRNAILVGRKGASFLESGYVYAPYVPLQTTPTIFGPEDFVPRKGVMTRYAKKMVRPDMYGLVIVRGLLGESGGSGA